MKVEKRESKSKSDKLQTKMKPEKHQTKSKKTVPDENLYNKSKYQGSCYCGSCEFICEDEPIFRVICHCSICTRLSGGIAVAFVGFENEKFQMIKGSEYLKSFKATERMERFFCEKCSSSVYNQSLLKDRLFRDTPLMNFKRDKQGNIVDLDKLQPESHIFFSQCQQCYIDMFKTDGLIKFSSIPGSTIILNSE